jgi:antitoxin CptB
MSVNVDAIKEAEQRRLTWRCRRGMLELDIVLQRFMAQHFYSLTMDELAAFDVLLEMPDNEFWGLLQNKNINLNATQQSIVNKLNAI